MPDVRPRGQNIGIPGGSQLGGGQVIDIPGTIGGDYGAGAPVGTATFNEELILSASCSPELLFTALVEDEVELEAALL